MPFYLTPEQDDFNKIPELQACIAEALYDVDSIVADPKKALVIGQALSDHTAKFRYAVHQLPLLAVSGCSRMSASDPKDIRCGAQFSTQKEAKHAVSHYL